MTFTVDQTRFNDQLAALQSALLGAGQMGDAANVVRDESKRFLVDVMRKTPPKSLAQGRNAVARDIRRAMAPLDQGSFDDPSVKKLIRERDVDGFNEFLKNAMRSQTGGRNLAGWRAEQFDPNRLHRQSQDRRGRIRSQKRTFVLDAKSWLKYVKEIQSHVGRMRSGWAPALRSVGAGDKIPAWVARHTDNPGAVVNDLGNRQFPSVTISNFAKGIRSVAHVVRWVLQARAMAIRRRVRLILSGYSRDMANGMKIQRKTGNFSNN